MMSHKYDLTKRVLFLSILIAMIISMTACVSSPVSVTSTSSLASGSRNVTTTPGIMVLYVDNNATLGKIIVDSKGLTVYTFVNDTQDVSNCNSTCAATWAPILSSGNPVAGSPDITGKLGFITRSDGSQQATYNGLPLYHFVIDNKEGDTNGNGYSNLWNVVHP